MTVCIDTNVVLGLFGRFGPWLAIREALIKGDLVWAVTSEILLEYEEVAGRVLGLSAAGQLLRFVELLDQTRGNIRRLSPTFRFKLIGMDPDDDKFADCAVVANADYIITSDRHFRSMMDSGYKPQPIDPADFMAKYFTS
jgi:uncharacterized protein